jgi:glutamate-5-semialdehyde dehydrogenase
MAMAIALDAKTQYPAACNSVETILVHAAIAPAIVPSLARCLVDAGVEVRGCERSRAHAASDLMRAASPKDWGYEYGELIVALRVVDDIASAVAHIAEYGSGHTEAIVSDDAAAAAYFLSRVDAAGVFHNASTRFADGYRYGLGAEVGISTNKLHARGPVGLVGLTTYKYLLHGQGHVVATYSGSTARRFHHRALSVPVGLRNADPGDTIIPDN